MLRSETLDDDPSAGSDSGRRRDMRVVQRTTPGKGNAFASGFAAARGDIGLMLHEAAPCSADKRVINLKSESVTRPDTIASDAEAPQCVGHLAEIIA